MVVGQDEAVADEEPGTEAVALLVVGLLWLAEVAKEPLHRIFLLAAVAVVVILVGGDARTAARQTALRDFRLARLETRVDVHHHRAKLLDERRQRRHGPGLSHGLGSARRVGGLRVGGEDRGLRRAMLAGGDQRQRGDSGQRAGEKSCENGKAAVHETSSWAAGYSNSRLPRAFRAMHATVSELKRSARARRKAT